MRFYFLNLFYNFIVSLNFFNSLLNAVIEQVGFDFINPPTVECEYYFDKPKSGLGRFTGGKEAVIKIKKFYSNVISKKPIPEEDRGFKALSMVMIDFDYNGEWFNLSKQISAKDLEKNNWEIRLDSKNLEIKL